MFQRNESSKGQLNITATFTSAPCQAVQLLNVMTILACNAACTVVILAFHAACTVIILACYAACTMRKHVRAYFMTLQLLVLTNGYAAGTTRMFTSCGSMDVGKVGIDSHFARADFVARCMAGHNWLMRN